MNQPEPTDPMSAEFDAIYQQSRREVWALAYARWTDADLASDLTQEAFFRLWRERARGETIDNPRAWLLRVVRNLAEDAAKSAFRRNGTQGPEQFAVIRSQDRGPLEQLEQAETFARIRDLLAELPVADREILTLRYALDHDASTIAEMLGLNVTAVHMRLSRARQKLAERLAAHGVSSSS